MDLLLPAFLLGFAGSLHCVGMCGPIVLALPVRFQSSFLLNRLQYNLGRISTYAILGFFVGFIGLGAKLAQIQQPLSIALGILVIILYFSSGSLNFEGKLGAWVNKQIVSRMRSALGETGKKGSGFSFFGLGSLNGLLPCGLVYIGLIGSTGNADPVKSAAFMAVFGLGTLPAMIGVNYFGEWFKEKILNRSRIIIPVFVILFGSLLILRGLDLGIPYLSPKLSTVQQEGSSCHKEIIRIDDFYRD